MNARRLIRTILHDEKSGGLLLLICTVISLIVANSPLRELYSGLWHTYIGGLSIEHWINDALMAVFFLLIGLELEREIYIGEFSQPKNAVLPIAAAVGGMLFPAGIFLFFNYNTDTVSGIGIPMATDIAFALGILSLLGNRVPTGLKLFLMALAVIDDLGAIIIIALFYTKEFSLNSLLIALGVYAVLIAFNRLKVYRLLPYFIGGAIMWYFMYKSGVHATITGVLLAFVIPFAGRSDAKSPSFYLMHKLHVPVTFIILPLFALANTAITIQSGWQQIFTTPLAYGILAGLVLGKPLGIFLSSFLVVATKIAKLPEGLNLKRITGVGFLAGIGFTMSIFIAILAFDDIEMVNAAKIVVLTASLIAAVIGFILLKLISKKIRS